MMMTGRMRPERIAILKPMTADSRSVPSRARYVGRYSEPISVSLGIIRIDREGVVVAARGAMRALGWLLVALGVLLAVLSFVIVAIVPTANPWPITGIGFALIVLGIAVMVS
jgi:hypothetical protein